MFRCRRCSGIAFKGDAFDANVVDTTFKTNYYGVLDAIEAFLPLVRENGRIVNTSSMVSVSTLRNMTAELRAQFLDENLTIEGLTALLQEFRDAVADGTWQEKQFPKSAYGFSKVGCSILSKILARNLPRGITLNFVCPGWCRTDMAGDKGQRTCAHACIHAEKRATGGRLAHRSDRTISISLSDARCLCCACFVCPPAPRSAEQGAETLAYVCLLPAGDKTNGQFFEPAQPEAGAKISSLTRPAA